MIPLRGVCALADDAPERRWPARRVVEGAIAGGAIAVQLRLKRTPDAQALELARWAVGRCRFAGAALIVNDRFDLADLAGAEGVHLGQDDVAPEEIPAPLRERLAIGLSTHTLEQVRQSRDRPIDYIGFGPVFGTRSKTSEYSARGLERLAEAVAAARHPVVAIGGIDAENIDGVARAGAAAAALIGAVADAAVPAAATRELQRRFEAAGRA
ncbi:MAG: thiamine phosphate synthase [Proteobacteria bacterium]|nr:thiamine phosphate synthase [Pseudomonadota bacterium]